MKLFNIQTGHVASLAKTRMPLEAVFVLELMSTNEDVPEELNKFLQYLQRKAYVSMKGEITQFGKQLYDSLFEESIVMTKRQVRKDDDFDRWWNVYPSTDMFTMHGRTFKGTQSKKTMKDKCKEHFHVIMNEGLTADDIIRATSYVVNTAKEESFKKNQNQLSFITNSERFLRERKFAPFVEISRKREPEKHSSPVKDFEI